jgi:hypothetical protein
MKYKNWLRPPLKCPFCLLEISDPKPPDQCARCQEPLPKLYIEGYQKRSPFFVQVLGWSRVGKTVYLYALTLLLRKMGKVWPRYTLTPATKMAADKLREIIKYETTGVMPNATQPGENSLYIMLLHNMQRWGNRALVTRDCAGELIEDFLIPIDQIPYLFHAPTTLMLISLADLYSSQDGKSADMLMFSYINTLKDKNVDFRRQRRRVVVVLSKGDLIEDLPANLRDYLMSDPIWATLNTSGATFRLDTAETTKYLHKMTQISDEIKDWLQNGDAAWTNFVNLAHEWNIDLRFSVISSTGGPVGENNTLPNALAPHRVLDPYFWALEFQS